MAVQTGEKPTSIADLKPKMALTGVVKKVELFGAFVDVGVGQDGLLHISQLSSGHVRNVTDVVKEGDSVEVWVQKIDTEKNRFSLTMLQPPEVSWDDIKRGAVLTGKITRVEKFGAFVDIGAERAGRIHVSELAVDYVKDPSDVVKVGDEVQVKVLSVNSRKRQIDLSIKALEEPMTVAAIEEDNSVQLPTAMELALRAAMEGTEMEGALNEARRERRSKKRSRKSRRAQEDILARTLNTRKS